MQQINLDLACGQNWPSDTISRTQPWFSAYPDTTALCHSLRNAHPRLRRSHFHTYCFLVRRVYFNSVYVKAKRPFTFLVFTSSGEIVSTSRNLATSSGMILGIFAGQRLPLWVTVMGLSPLEPTIDASILRYCGVPAVFTLFLFTGNELLKVWCWTVQ